MTNHARLVARAVFRNYARLRGLCGANLRATAMDTRLSLLLFHLPIVLSPAFGAVLSRCVMPQRSLLLRHHTWCVLAVVFAFCARRVREVELHVLMHHLSDDVVEGEIDDDSDSDGSDGEGRDEQLLGFVHWLRKAGVSMWQWKLLFVIVHWQASIWTVAVSTQILLLMMTATRPSAALAFQSLAQKAQRVGGIVCCRKDTRRVWNWRILCYRGFGAWAAEKEARSAQRLLCPICLTSVSDSDAPLQCSHTFHFRCILNWLACDAPMSDMCPVCRAVISYPPPRSHRHWRS